MKQIRVFVPSNVQQQLSDSAALQLESLPDQSRPKNEWLSPAALCSGAGAEVIAVTHCVDTARVSKLLARLTDALSNMSSISSAIVCGDEPIPGSLRTSLPEGLHPWLRRPQVDDLLLLDTEGHPSSLREASMLEGVLKQSPMSCAVHEAPSHERFPVAGPARTPVAANRLQPLIQEAVAALQISNTERRCVESGLLLLWDCLDESHEISQTMEGNGSPQTADYWHGIMHRREPDAGNASYWFRRVGSHPAFEHLGLQLVDWMKELAAGPEMIELTEHRLIRKRTFDPFAMIELSTAAIRTPGSLSDQTCCMVQYLEILNLLAWSMTK